MKEAFISLGSNLGNRGNNLKEALQRISKNAGRVKKISGTYKTTPWGNSNQNDFYNQVVLIETSLTPQLLMDQLLNIELEMGRVRDKKWEPRIIDLDLLFYSDQEISDEKIIVPHPELHKRNFILIPLCEIAPHFIHPVFKKSLIALKEESTDKGTAELISTTTDEHTAV